MALYGVICVIVLAVVDCFGSSVTFNVTIDMNSIIHVTSDRYLGITLDTHLIRYHWRSVDLSNQQLIEAAKALRPLYLRVGGTSSDFLIFNETTNARNKDQIDNFIMTVSDWEKLNNFVQNIPECELYFGLNLLLRKDNSWDPTNARKLLNYTNRMNYKVNFELGNEPAEFKRIHNTTLSPEQEGKDFLVLRNLLNTFPNLRKSLIAGPDSNRPTTTLDYLLRFVKVAGPVLETITWHHYYADGRTATVETFTDANILDSLKHAIEGINTSLRDYKPPAYIWQGESSSTYNSGTTGLSDRYIAGFMWLDKLGMSAMLGQGAVLRQSLVSGNYALLNDDYTPRPDFWLSWIYKKLVSKYVLHVTIKPSTNKVRLYAHCLQKSSLYADNTVVLYGMNLLNEDVNVWLPTLMYDKGAYVYWLTPGDDDKLHSRFVKLNGMKLQPPERDWPPLPSSTMFIPAGEPLTLKSKTFGFFTLLSAHKNICNTYKIDVM